MMTSAEAEILARVEHAEQVDRAERLYIDHVERVAAASERRAQAAALVGFPINVDHVVQAAWLHDVIEDTPITAADLRKDGYAEAVIEMVELLTKPEAVVSYAERIAGIIASGNLGAILIKLSDNEDNASPDRPLPEGSTLPARYAASIARLREAAETLGYDGP